MQNPTVTLLAVALVAGGAAGALAATYLVPSAVDAGEGPDQAVVGRPQGELSADLVARLYLIEQRLEELEIVPVSTNLPISLDPGAANADTEDRLAKIEESFAAMVAAEKSREIRARAFTELPPNLGPVTPPRNHEDARLTVLDPTLGEDAKIQAWRELRDAEVWGDDVVLEMIRIGQTSTDPSIRADVWRQADGRDRNELLVDPMMDAMRNDPHTKVRDEAIETLANYKDRPDVLAALQYIAANDPDLGVRREALKALGSD